MRADRHEVVELVAGLLALADRQPPSGPAGLLRRAARALASTMADGAEADGAERDERVCAAPGWVLRGLDVVALRRFTRRFTP